MALSRVKSDLIVKLDASKVVGALPALVGTNLLGVSAGGADQFSRNNLALNFFEDSVRDNMDRLSLSQGWVDTFEDNSDVVGEGFSVPMTLFDGTNDNINLNTNTIGMVNGPDFLFSCIVNFSNIADGTAVTIITSDNLMFPIKREASNKLSVSVGGASTTDLGGVTSTSTFLAAEGNIHIQVAVNTATQTIQIVKNGVLETNVVTHTLNTGTISLIDGTCFIGSKGSLGQLWFGLDFLDLSVQANREKFVSGTGASAKPVNLGTDGTTPTGSQPVIYLNNPFGTFQNNLGSGGNFTESGQLGDGGYLDLSDTNALYSSESFTNSYDLIDSYRPLTSGFFVEEVGNTGFNSMAGQCINLPTDSLITKVAFHVFETGSPPLGYGAAIIMGATGTVGTNAVGNDSIMASVRFDITTMATSPSMIEYTFEEPVNLPAGDYFFGMRYDALDGNGGRRLRMQSDNSSPTHAGNVAVKDQSGNWTAASGRDLAFRLYGQKNLDLVTKGSDDIGNSPASAPDTGHIELLMTERPAGGTSVNSNSLSNASGGSNWGIYTLRQVILNGNISASGSWVRVKFQASTIEPWHVDNFAIVERSSGPDGTVVPTELKFGGSSGINLATGTSAWSDWTYFDLDSTKDYLVIFDMTSQFNTSHMTTATVSGEICYYSTSNATSYNVAIMPGNRGSDLVNTHYAVSAIEVGVDQVVNTDYIAEMSRDGGTTYSPATLNRLKTRVGATNKNILGGAVDFAGDPSGTDIVGRVRSVNKDKITVHGVSVNWS
tara:strand:- start:210 stop:2528 length:2319 start_codon:yes stop_codon:yes gene_type:complete